MVGRDTIVNLLFSLVVGRADATHTVTNPRVQVNGCTARLTAMVQAQHLPDADRDSSAISALVLAWAARRATSSSLPVSPASPAGVSRSKHGSGL